MTVQSARHILCQARDAGSIEWVYFEGGEPFLCYPLLLASVREAKEMGFQVGVVSNAYWAKDEHEALEHLAPLSGLVDDLTISSDRYHGIAGTRRASHALSAAKRLNIPTLTVSLDSADPAPIGISDVMHRGRAAERLAVGRNKLDWARFTECPHEDLENPTRAHVDAFGDLYVCQGIRIGNVFRASLSGICRSYRPQECPIASALLEGGPAELVRRYELPHNETYADACHLCYQARACLRQRFPKVLGPDQMYGKGCSHKAESGARTPETAGLTRASHMDKVRAATLEHLRSAASDGHVRGRPLHYRAG